MCREYECQVIHEGNFAEASKFHSGVQQTMLMKTKPCMLNSNFKSVLSYGCETWEVATHITNKLQKFVNQSLRGIMSIRWSEIIINTGLWEAAREEPIILQIRMTKWQGSVIL